MLWNSTDAPTRERVARSILELGPSTAAALAERLDLTPAAVRRHLDHLVADGRGRGPRAAGLRHPRARSPGQGLRADRRRPRPLRPAVRRPRRRGAALPGRDRGRRGRRRRSPAAGSPTSSAAYRRDRRAAPRMSSPPRRWREALTAERLRRLGPHRAGRRPALPAPLPGGARRAEFPQLCEAETEVISRVLGTHVQRLATIAHGDGVCTTCIPGTPGTSRDRRTVMSSHERLSN